MCSFFWQRMENDHGDLADVVRASSSRGSDNKSISDWQFPSEHAIFPLGIEEPTDDFGDPFSNMRDPLLHELDLAGSGLFNSSNSTHLVKMSVNDNSSLIGGSLLSQKIMDEDMKRPCNIFSRMLQISPNEKLSVSLHNNSVTAAASALTSPRGITTSAVVSNDMVKATSSTGCLMDNGGVQISSPRNPGIKRRKSQAKKVVSIPAPAAANSRPGGEVVPSDLWAWRKYGQKPIKGSPYPRGYYRCSSSKGCSARKQVERSRIDPNMLVITYTSEHNHPWPTQRNALAGSTRSQPIKNNAASKSSAATHTQNSINLKEEHKENSTNSAIASVKEETVEMENPLDMDEGEFNQVIHHSYRPALPDSNQAEDFFADLGEIEPDPLNLLFSQDPGFTEEKSDEERENKGLDPFSLFDWTGSTSFGETTRGL
ncbi:hypothetical protein HHK36_001469 [Tetracentron sinense]|uniref:WRKY domain-containing protein n=1 Tax=Tetracentron sinense TaxID=13715 RepID=A0A835A3Q7_TETSI|nr:hypothetical protein HHK36_001469 [Tetracentron sinense]